MSRSWLLPLGTGTSGAVLVTVGPHSVAALVLTIVLVCLTGWLCLSAQGRGRWSPRLGLGSAAVLIEVVVLAGLVFGQGSWFTTAFPSLVVVAMVATGAVMWRLLQERFSGRAAQQLLITLVAATSALVPIWVILIEPHLAPLDGGDYAARARHDPQRRTGHRHRHRRVDARQHTRGQPDDPAAPQRRRRSCSSVRPWPWRPSPPTSRRGRPSSPSCCSPLGWSPPPRPTPRPRCRRSHPPRPPA